MSYTDDLIKDIRETISQRSASRKDEQRVMMSLLNDKAYKVDVYSAMGKVDEYCPSSDARKLVHSVLVNGAHLPSAEASAIADSYEFTKSETNAIIGISKEFINTYVRTGRKLPIGGREDMNVSLSLKEISEQKKKLPINSLNSKESTVTIPKHATIKSQGGCPVWIRSK